MRAILLRELGSLGTRHALFLARLVLLVLLAFVLGIAICGSMSSGRGGGMTYRAMADVGRTFFLTFYITELVLVWLLVAVMTGGVIATEREQRTLDLLLMAPPGVMRILFGKFLSRIAVLLFVIAYSAPFLFAGLALGGVGTDEVWKATVHVIAHGVLACGLTFFYSATKRNPRNASGGTIGLIVTGAILLPFLEGMWAWVSGGPRNLGLTMYLHPFYATLSIIHGQPRDLVREWVLPAVWIALGFLLVLLAGRIVAIRTYVNPPEHINPRTRTARKGLESLVAIGRAFALIAAVGIGAWIAFAPEDLMGLNHLWERPLYPLTIFALFVFVFARRVREGLTRGEARAWSTSMPPEANPMQWKYATFEGILPRWRGDLAILACLLICVGVARTSTSYYEEVLLATVMACTVITTLLFVLIHFSLFIAQEREKRTLDLLLLTTAPRSMLLDSGWAVMARMMWPLFALLAAGSLTALFSPEYRVHLAQLVLAWAILFSAVIVHGYWGLWASFLAKKANAALALGLGLPLLAYTVVPMLDAFFMLITRFGSTEEPISLAINPIFLSVYLVAEDNGMKLAMGLPIQAAGVLYVIGALIATAILRTAVLARMDTPER